MKTQDTAALLREKVAIVLPENGIEEKLQRAREEHRPLVVKLGFDPTAPDLHLGHAVVLKKLRQFQDLGHTVAIIIGDFTARIGDPTGKNKARPPLSSGQVLVNARTYTAQLGKILDMDKCRIRFNSEWLEAMGMTDTIRLLAQVTLAQVLQRTDFHNRHTKNIPIAMHELIYPMLQGHDSVQVCADIEMGGTDQLFNCSMGRQMQEGNGQPGQAVVCMPLLRGIDGSVKMSKSEGNTVGLTEAPEEIFGKIMSMPDALLSEYLLLATDIPSGEQQEILASLDQGANPMTVKKMIAFNIVRQYHSEEQALLAQSFFEQQFQKRGMDDKQFEKVSLPELGLPVMPHTTLIDICKSLKPMMSRSHLRRLIESAGVTVNGIRVVDPGHVVDFSQLPVKLKLGKRDYFELQ